MAPALSASDLLAAVPGLDAAGVELRAGRPSRRRTKPPRLAEYPSGNVSTGSECAARPAPVDLAGIVSAVQQRELSAQVALLAHPLRL